jgi:hypothetical protein
MQLPINAWREILARIFAGFSEQDNVSPDWLVNPATRRRLKLDKYYPEAGVAIRFIGLLAKGQGRQSDWEVLETEQRDQTRSELCQANGVQLVLIDAAEEAPKQLDALISNLSRTSRLLAQSQRSANEKQRWMPALSDARAVAVQLRTLIAKNPEQMMANLAESWRDRESQLSNPLSPNTPPVRTISPGQMIYRVDQRVCHVRYGEGVITQISGSASDPTLTILFDGAQERTFQCSLVQGKLAPVR